jgi:drug/metabolite transporter (DMT)-like permease
MNWIVADLLMFLCSVALYLAVRKAALDKLPSQFNNLAMFFIPLFVFAAGCVFSHTSYGISLKNAVLLVLTGVILAYLSNAISMKSIELAPNPGYSLVISKSYVVLTTFLAVPLFGAHLSVKALAAILLIVSFSALIMVNPKAAHHAKSAAWLPLAIGAFFGWGFLSLAAKYFFAQGLSTFQFLAYMFTVVCICIFAEMCLRRVSFQPLLRHWPSFVLIGVTASGFNFFNFYAIRLAPNVGYVNATNAASIAVVTIFAILLFKDEFSIKKLVGVLGVVGGLVLLCV